MKQNNLEQCCNQKPIAIVEYDLGSLGKKKFKVCQKHFHKDPWNRYMLSTKNLEND